MSTPAREATISDVAREAKVSIATVSRVLNATARVDEAKRRRVLDAVDKLGYSPNPFMRSLLRGSSGSVGVLVPMLADEHYGGVVEGIERTLRGHGLHMLCAIGGNAGDVENELAYFKERRTDGLILFADFLSEARLLELARSPEPLVLLGRHTPELSDRCVRLNNVRGGALATEHLLALGHTRILHLAGPQWLAGFRERVQGYVSTLVRAGLDPDPDLIREAEPSSEEGAREAVARMLQHQGEFTAVFAASDKLALGTMTALREAGHRIPQDVSVVGFNDRSYAAHLNPPLTTLHYPVTQMGEVAASHLAALLRGETPAAPALIEPHLVVRGSSGPAKL